MTGTKSEFCEDNRSIVTLRMVFAKTVSRVLFGSLSRRGGPRETRSRRKERDFKYCNNIIARERSLSDTFPKLYCEDLLHFFRMYIYPGIFGERMDFFLFLYRARLFLYSHFFFRGSHSRKIGKRFVIVRDDKPYYRNSRSIAFARIFRRMRF